MLNKLKLGALLVIGGVLAGAQIASVAYASGYACTFTTTCYEETGCENKTLIITVDESIKNQPQLILPGMTIGATKQVDEIPGIVAGTVSYVSNLERNIVHLLTIFNNGEARFASHSYLNSAFSIHNIGSCEPN